MSKTTEAMIREVVAKTFEEFPGAGQIGMEDDLTAIGMNSLSFVQLVVAIEEAFGIEFDDDMLDQAKFPNLLAFANYLEAKTTSGPVT